MRQNFQMRKIKNSRAILLVLSLMLTSCSLPIENSPNHYANQSKKEIKYQNGLTIKLPPPLSVFEDENGFRISPNETENVRYSIDLSVSVYLNQVPPSDSQTQRKQIGGREIFYRRTQGEAGGASGDEIIYNLKAWEIITNGFILYEQNTPESHFNEHRFDALWYVLENTSFQAKILCDNFLRLVRLS